MTIKDACLLGAGGWPPKDNTGGHQNQAILDSAERNQLQPDCFSKEETTEICNAIQKKYAAVSSSAEGYFRYTVGKAGALQLGYDSDLVEQAPSELICSFCGVGNPFSISPLQEGSVVLDIGCGAGFDLFIASRHVGEQGKVIGVDLTEEMIEKARSILEKLEMHNAEIHLISTEKLPFEDCVFDVVLSNGVINLSPEKLKLLTEIFRVMKPGGRLQIADIILDKKLPPHLAASVESWSQWIGGAISGRDQLELIEKAGFSGVELVGTTVVRTSDFTVGALFTAIKSDKSEMEVSRWEETVLKITV